MMSAKKGFCGKHQSAIANRLQFLGMWKHVRTTGAEEMADIARAWLHGQLRLEMLCPLTILGLELQAKANRMAEQMSGTKGVMVATCPLCAIQRMANDETADVKVLVGMADVILGLMQSNGLMGGDPSPALLPKVKAAPRSIIRTG
jgi:hypothetical protein